ncbi:hypothetical protein CEXT_464841 [Caerostris extrusa]|uniref:Uncharacterized protein n=1 Tax=Caerostris extrusa TaxID=172846 RepID=A0AAV4XUF9_CAEEX|nr:hypothetical protein CEXT_464841 [Caerostris extrusa]
MLTNGSTLELFVRKYPDARGAMLTDGSTLEFFVPKYDDLRGILWSYSVITCFSMINASWRFRKYKMHP